MKQPFAILFCCLVATTTLFISCEDLSAYKWKAGEYKEIDAITFNKMLKANPELILLDVRTPEEFAEGSIKNAININYGDPQFNAELNKLDRTKPYIVYCKSGLKSRNTVRALQFKKFAAAYYTEEGYEGITKASN